MTSTRMINLDDLIQAASRGDPGAQERLTDTQQLALFRRDQDAFDRGLAPR